MIVKVPADTLKLQDESDKFVNWCHENGLELQEMRDIGIFMDPKMSFVLQINKNK